MRQTIESLVGVLTVLGQSNPLLLFLVIVFLAPYAVFGICFYDTNARLMSSIERLSTGITILNERLQVIIHKEK